MDRNRSGASLRRQCEKALANALARVAPRVSWAPDRSDYVGSPEHNLVPGLALDDVCGDFGQGAGSELAPRIGQPAKFCAAYSSAALAVNAFGPFKSRPQDLKIFGHDGFACLRFEARCPTGLSGTPPHLDVLCETEGEVLAIESKCTEYLTPKPASFSEKYDRLQPPAFERAWLGLFDELKKNPMAYVPLDAAQLVKHYLGLRHTYPERRCTLAYLFWEPENANAPIFQHHRSAIARFSEAVSDSEVRFIATSYADLWSDMKQAKERGFRPEYLDFLTLRYVVNL